MNERLSEVLNQGNLNISIPTTSQESKSVSVAAMSGSYSIVNDTLTVSIKLMDNALSLEDLLTPISPSDMAELTADMAKSHSEKASNCILSPNNPEQRIVEDNEYYLSMFEGVQFSVPRWRFPENSVLDLPPDQDTYASTRDDVSAQDFRCLMEFMYPFDPSPLPTRHWVSVLKLSSIWHMYDYRKQALSSDNFRDLEPDEKIVLGRLCGIPEWYREGCFELVRGDSELDASHEAIIGIDVMVKIAQARDSAYRDTVVRFPDLASSASEVPDSFVAEDNSSTTGSSIIHDICTARENGLSRWLRCCYERLIYREESITLEEAATLGLETTIGIWKARRRLFQKYRDILKLKEDLNFTAHVEAQFAIELEEARRLQDIFGSAPSMAISMSMDDFFNPQSVYFIINLKFNTCLDLTAAGRLAGGQFHGGASQKWIFQRIDSWYQICNARYRVYLSESEISDRSLYFSIHSSKFFVGRASSDEPNIYGIFLSESPQPTARAVRMMAASDCVLLDSWDGGQAEGWKWKIVTLDEARKHFGLA